MTEAERAELEDSLRFMDGPQCSCPLKSVALCVRLGKPCSERERDGKCDCARTPGPPCKHMADHDHETPLEKWIELLRMVWPDEFADRPQADKPAMVLTREARVAIKQQRFEAGEGLWHPGDLTDDDMDRLGRRVTLSAGNFRPVETGLVVLGDAA